MRFVHNSSTLLHEPWMLCIISAAALGLNALQLVMFIAVSQYNPPRFLRPQPLFY